MIYDWPWSSVKPPGVDYGLDIRTLEARRGCVLFKEVRNAGKQADGRLLWPFAGRLVDPPVRPWCLLSECKGTKGCSNVPALTGVKRPIRIVFSLRRTLSSSEPFQRGWVTECSWRFEDLPASSSERSRSMVVSQQGLWSRAVSKDISAMNSEICLCLFLVAVGLTEHMR